MLPGDPQKSKYRLLLHEAADRHELVTHLGKSF